MLLLLMVVGLFGVGIFSLFKLASWGAGFVPFKYETMLAQQVATLPFSASNSKADPDVIAAQSYLQELANTAARAQNLPADMPITVHLVLDDTVNGFATLGGHVILHQGLLERLPSENALMMLLGHEIGHVYHRHPIRSVSGAVVGGLFVEFITGGSGWGAALIGEQASRLLINGFSRDQERQSDAYGAEVLQRVYGHTTGARQLFEVLQAEEGNFGPRFEMLSTHPNTKARAKGFQQATQHPLTALKVDFSDLK